MTQVNLHTSRAHAAQSGAAPGFEPAEGASVAVPDARADQAKPRSLLELERFWGCGRLPFNCAIRLLLAVMSELQQLHERGQVHGELTPAHVLLLEGGGVRLLTAARTPQALPDLRKAGILRYLAPERLRAAELGATADVFSVGVMLWEAVAGKPLFERPTVAGALPRWRQFPAPLAPARSRELWVNSLSYIAARALEVEPERRYPEMQRLRAAVELLAGAHVAPVASWDALVRGTSLPLQRLLPTSSAADKGTQSELEIARLPDISRHGAWSDDSDDTIFDLSAMPSELELEPEPEPEPAPTLRASTPSLPSLAAAELSDDELPTRFIDTSGRSLSQAPRLEAALSPVRSRRRRARPAEARPFRVRPLASAPVLAEPLQVKESPPVLVQTPIMRSNERTLRAVWVLVVVLAMMVGIFSAAVLSSR